MTEADLEAIEARANAATPGDWHPGDQTNETAVYDGPPRGAYSREIGDFYEVADAVFASHARIDIPALVAEVRRLRAGEKCGALGGRHSAGILLICDDVKGHRHGDHSMGNARWPR